MLDWRKQSINYEIMEQKISNVLSEIYVKHYFYS
jgi:hypothetical protein